jgi:two-component system osmolarity sensor histidine kinase EnvZ
MWCPALTMNPSPRFDRADWLRLFFYLIGGCGFTFALFWVALNTFLEPKLVSETALRTSRSVGLVELALQLVPPEKLPQGVIVNRSWQGPEGEVRSLDAFDRKVQLLMQSQYQVTRQIQRDQRPFVDSWGGMWVRLETFHTPPIWLYQPERLSTSSAWFLPLLRSAALFMGLAIGTILFLKQCVETPFNKVFSKLPDGLPAPLPLLPEQGISPLRVLSLRINRLLERLNNVAAERRAFLRGIVHDLAGPQTRIGLHLELMSDSLADSHQDALQAMMSDMRQLEAITQQLALLAERDQPVVSVQQLALDDLCTRLATSYGGQSIDCKVPRLLVRLDASGLERSLCNLIDNALDHGQPPVEIDAWTKKATLVLQVKDQGRAPSKANLLTMPTKSPAYDRQRRRHRGLGLAIVERFCRDHQGSLTVLPSDQGFIVQMHLVATQEGPVVL